MPCRSHGECQYSLNQVNRCAICVARGDQLGLLLKRPYSDRDHLAYECLWRARGNDRYVMQSILIELGFRQLILICIKQISPGGC